MPTDIRTVHTLKRGSEAVPVSGKTRQHDSLHALYEAAWNLSRTARRAAVDCAGMGHLGALAVQILRGLPIALTGAGGAWRVAGTSEHFPEVPAGGNTCRKKC